MMKEWLGKHAIFPQSKQATRKKTTEKDESRDGKREGEERGRLQDSPGTKHSGVPTFKRVERTKERKRQEKTPRQSFPFFFLGLPAAGWPQGMAWNLTIQAKALGTCFGRWRRGQATTLSGAPRSSGRGLGSEADVDSTRIRSPVGVPQVTILITVEALLRSVLIAQSSEDQPLGKTPSVTPLARAFAFMRVHSAIGRCNTQGRAKTRHTPHRAKPVDPI